MSAADGGSPAARLERAIEIYLRHVESGSGDARGLLHRHAELRDLLEPMLASGPLDPGIRSGVSPPGEVRSLDFDGGASGGS